MPFNRFYNFAQFFVVLLSISNSRLPHLFVIQRMSLTSRILFEKT